MVLMSKKEEMTLKTYAEIAKTRNNTHNNLYFWKKEFEEFKIFLPKGIIIDIDCEGGGDATLFLNQEYRKIYSYVGIDASREMLQEAKRLVPKAIFLEMNMYELTNDFAESVNLTG